MIRRYILFWFLLMMVAILNGILRQSLFLTSFGEHTAHQISTVTGIIFIFIVVWLLNKRWKIESRQQAVYIGLIWLLMTVLFEFGFGHFVMGHSWTHLLADYNLLAGRVWSLFLLFVFIVPSLVHHLDQKS